MSYLNGRIDSMEPATLAISYINGKRRYVVDDIVRRESAEAACLTLLILDELISRKSEESSPKDVSDQFYRYLATAVGEDRCVDCGRPSTRTRCANCADLYNERNDTRPADLHVVPDAHLEAQYEERTEMGD